ncbi:MAG: metallophosphoesterase, partial [Salinisphaeraceae bacterium]|nr:metallophosphoesterase [Salinisphaeraceae bacterium]
MAVHHTDRPFALVQISDPHLYADPDTEYRGWNTDQALDALLAFLNSENQPIDALLLSGDLAQDELAATYTRLNEKLKTFTAPIFALPGNHDNPPAIREILKAQYLGEAQLGCWRLLLLNSHQPGITNGFLDDAELARAQAFVNSLDGPGLIAVHHQPLPIGSPWMDSIGLDNGEKLIRIVEAHHQVQGILFGHVHQAVDTQQRGIRLLGCPSSWRQFLPGACEPAEDLTAQPGYRRLWL